MAQQTGGLLTSVSTLCELYLEGTEGMARMLRTNKATGFKHLHRLWVKDDSDRDGNRAR